MQHIDDEDLALLALGEDVLDDAARAHLDSCPACSASVRELAVVADVARSAERDRDLVAPAPRVWDAVRGELGLGLAAPAETDAESEAEADAVAPADAGTAPLPAEREPTPDLPHTGASVVPLASRRPRAWLPVAAAACLALFLGVAGGVWWERRETEPPETTLATADLEALPAWTGASGQARVEEAPDGTRQVVVSVDAPAPEGTYREVWLLAEDVSGLVSLGVLEGSEGRFDVPDGLDLAAFPVVDVSEEHFDGDPAHSGDSVVRGPLDA
ncbi:anti-sigma factor [Cellulosimicrobium sp. CUA-896]|uniref:anti-sigma factor n=1 Tax=Cellulosimicrobium sp. CUA-896 TaxID=1517881 RepID=UPI000960095A|nr:anti-sigma factor [Cellulosimicrobium sp. CUA-896]OLT46144.1 hypothetical protein BJF88_04825 [Cellulosimicrobium sp. CUA-896]